MSKFIPSRYENQKILMVFKRRGYTSRLRKLKL